MSAQRVIPGWPEAEEHFARRRYEGAHDTKHFRGVGKMLKGIQGYDNVREVRGRSSEHARPQNARGECLLPAFLQNLFTDIDTGYVSSPFLGHFYRLGSAAATEVDDHFPCNTAKKIFPEECPELRLTLVTGFAAEAGISLGDFPQNSVLKLGPHRQSEAIPPPESWKRPNVISSPRLEPTAGVQPSTCFASETSAGDNGFKARTL